MHLTSWLFGKTGRTAAISQHRLASLLFEYLISERGASPEEISTLIVADFTRRGQRRIPREIRDAARPVEADAQRSGNGADLPKRQRNRRR